MQIRINAIDAKEIKYKPITVCNVGAVCFHVKHLGPPKCHEDISATVYDLMMAGF